MSTFSQYYRVKRQHQTIFINTSNPNTDTVLALKQRIIKALSSSRNQDGAVVPKAPSDIQLQIPNKKNSSAYLELIDSKTLFASGLVDQQVIAMTFRTTDGAWEDVDIAQPEAVEDLEDLEDEPDELEATRRDKGKDRA